MMDWKDTVITSIEEVDGTTFLPADYISWREHQNLMEAQAEISLKAGDKDGWGRGYREGMDDGNKAGIDMGIREVVEWIEEYYRQRIKQDPEWQAQKKVWLDEKE